MLLAPPHLDGVFPWVRFAWPPAYFSRPAGYVVEPIIGAIWLAPFVGSLALTCRRMSARPIVWILVLSSAAILLFIAATGWSVQRYETDFLPFGVLAALGCAAAAVPRFSATHRRVFLTLLTVAIALGMIVNLALGISGPYDEMLENRPARYVRIARWFSPLQRYRLELNPDLNVTFHANIGRLPDRARKDLVTAGRSRHQYELYAEQSGDKLNLISRSENATATWDAGNSGVAGDFNVVYTPRDGEMHVIFNGQPIINHKIGKLVTAPSQVVVTH